jgi:hypothetical protein
MWDHETLYAKARLYIRKGLEHEEPESEEVPLWCILALELLARATLAKVSPALLADPTDGANVLYALGYTGKKAPRSIPAKTVFHRCTVICEGFTEEDYKLCMSWLNSRNEELHTGHLPFEGLRTSSWLSELYRVTQLLLEHNGSSLDDYIGKDRAQTALTMLESLSNVKAKEAHERVQAAREAFNALEIEDRLEKVRSAKKYVSERPRLLGRIKVETCPSCESPAFVTGSLVRSTNPRDTEGELVQDDVWLPVELNCVACGLVIDEHGHLAALGLGDQYTTVDVLDPQEYYRIEFDPEDYFGEGYSND